METNPGFIRLCSIKERTMKLSDLSELSKTKIKDTVMYSLTQNPRQHKPTVLSRCIVAQMAEQYVAEWMEGWCNHGSEDLSDPLSYGYDVLANIKYTGLRIEVKTHQSGSNYISVHTQNSEPFKGSSGLNIRPFLGLGVSDVMIIFDTSESKDVPGEWILEPVIVTTPKALLSKDVILKSNFDGWYINHRKQENISNIFYF